MDTEAVAVGYTRIKQIIAYRGNGPGQSYFCSTPEKEIIFRENNPGVKTETFDIQVLKSTAKELLKDPEKQFVKKGKGE